MDIIELFKKHFKLPPSHEALFAELDYKHDWEMHCNCKEVIPLKDFKDRKVDNFIYDRHMGLVFIDLPMAQHQFMMSFLFSFNRLHHGISTGTFDTFPEEDGFNSIIDLSEKYIDGCYGCYQSSVSEKIYKSEKMILTAKEKRAFCNYIIMDI